MAKKQCYLTHTPISGVVTMTLSVDKLLEEERADNKCCKHTIKVLREENEKLRMDLAEALDIGRSATKLTQDLIDKVRDVNSN